jgi:hypothetical protein
MMTLLSAKFQLESEAFVIQPLIDVEQAQADERAAV